MKSIVFFILFVVFPTSFSANAQTEQTITVCSLLTEYESVLKYCTEAITKGEETGKKCSEEIGFAGPFPPLVSQDVSDIILAIYTDIYNVCGPDLQCIHERMISVIKAEYCTDSD